MDYVNASYLKSDLFRALKRSYPDGGGYCHIPARAGVYIARDRDTEEVLYVGQTKNFRKRLRTHKWFRHGARVELITVEDRKQRLLVEGFMIAVLNPSLNKDGQHWGQP